MDALRGILADTAGGFNEAAADTAENVAGRIGRRPRHMASMRPRPIPRKTLPVFCGVGVVEAVASMRPRPIPRKTPTWPGGREGAQLASMRPRPIPRKTFLCADPGG